MSGAGQALQMLIPSAMTGVGAATGNPMMATMGGMALAGQAGNALGGMGGGPTGGVMSAGPMASTVQNAMQGAGMSGPPAQAPPGPQAPPLQAPANQDDLASQAGMGDIGGLYMQYMMSKNLARQRDRTAYAPSHTTPMTQMPPLSLMPPQGFALPQIG